MEWLWSCSVFVLCVFKLASAIGCDCGNGQQSLIPSYSIFNPPSPFNDNDGSPSSFGSTCVENMESIYKCTNNSDNPLFDCSADNNGYYGWERLLNPSFSIAVNFTSHIQSLKVLVTFLMSTSSNISAPTSIQHLITLDERLIVSLPANQVDLPTNLPDDEPYQHNFTLSSGGYTFNGVVISITPNPTFQWVAIGRIIFCTPISKDQTVTSSSVMFANTLHLSTVSPTVSASISPTTSVVPGLPISSNTENNLLSITDIIVITITAIAGIPLLIAFVVFLVIILLHGMKKKSRKIHENSKNIAIIKLPSQSDVSNDDCNSQLQCTQDNTVQSSDDHSDKDVLSQGAEGDATFRLEITDNTLYFPTKSISLDSLLQHYNSISTSVVDYDATITPNASYTVTPEGRMTSEQQYDSIQTDNELNQHDEFGYLKLVGCAALDGAYDEVTNPAGGDYISIDLNSSYAIPQDGQDVKLEDNPSYM